jgi:hypothetical protein
VSGFVDDVEALKDRLESHWENADQVLRESDDVHVITGLLKLYFRLLPIPLITFDAYPNLMSCMSKFIRTANPANQSRYLIRFELEQKKRH